MKKEGLRLFIGAGLVCAGIGMIMAGRTQTAEARQTPEVRKTWDPCGLSGVACDGQEERLSIVTAYNSVPGQTDDTPCIAADGSDICARRAKGESVCASNDWPLGTQIGLTGGANGTCVVRDRMKKRYTGTGRVDVYMGMDVKGAREFGSRNAIVTVL